MSCFKWGHKLNHVRNLDISVPIWVKLFIKQCCCEFENVVKIGAGKVKEFLWLSVNLHLRV